MKWFRAKKDFTIPAGGIDSLEKVMLGGAEQTILIQAENPSNPVLLFVHGGPCMPVPGVVSRGQDYAVATATKELVKHYVVVFWDQRGAGKSYHKSLSAETMRMEQYISDCRELIDHLREKFQQEKIYLAAHSWGTVIGLSVASRYPEKLHAYTGVSQIMNWTANDKFCYHWLKTKAEQRMDRKTLQKLDQIGRPPYTASVDNWIQFRVLLTKYNSMIYEDDTIKHPGMIGGFKIFLRSSDYSLLDIYHTFKSSYSLTYTQTLIEDFATIDFQAVRELKIPAYFLHGRQDMHLDGSPVEQFVSALNAPKKAMVWYENSSHMLHPDDAKQIEQYLIKVVKEPAFVPTV